MTSKRTANKRPKPPTDEAAMAALEDALYETINRADSKWAQLHGGIKINIVLMNIIYSAYIDDSEFKDSIDQLVQFTMQQRNEPAARGAS